MARPSRRKAYEDGMDAETFVAAYLADEGFVVVERNFRAAGGEIDIVVERNGAYRFVEVKARRPSDPTGLESITSSKQRKLRRAAEAWLQSRTVDEVAFMVAVVELAESGWTLELLDDAF